MKLLVAIPVCHAYNYDAAHVNAELHINGQQNRRIAVRETWLKDLIANNIDYKFFFGRGADREPLLDEVFFDCDDSYVGLIDKMKCIFRWALDHSYDYIFKCDDDAFVYVDKLLTCGFQQYDQFGFTHTLIAHHRFKLGQRQATIVGGSGYFLSEKGMRLLVDIPKEDFEAEDFWVHYHLQMNHLVQKVSRDFIDAAIVSVEDVWNHTPVISAHAIKPADMYRLYEAKK